MQNKNLAKLLIQKKLTLAVAESCTGGLISKLLTDIPGSSEYFKLGLVVYSNTAKSKFLKIPLSLIKIKGAVSKEVALLLAKNVRNIAKTDLGLGITGIAGPGGGTKDKPVGLVFIAISSTKKTIVKKFNFKGNRHQIRQKSASETLSLISKLIT